MSAPAAESVAAVPFHLAPASQFTIEQLTAAYNQTRVDYLVPMPMNPARLAEYVDHYDVDLDRSFVALADKQILGLGMLGVRPGRAWVTRLGVLPVERRQGMGWAISQALLAAGEELGVEHLLLEVIKNNTPAYNLFLKHGFEPVRELLVLRRPPGPPAHPPPGEVRPLERAEALALLETRPGPQSWITAAESFAHLEHLMGMRLSLPDGGRGWMVWHVQMFHGFPLLLSHLAVQTEAGEPASVGRALLEHLYRQHPDLDTHAENLSTGDPHLPSFFDLNFVVSFERIEMHRLKRGEAQPA
jgi:ribosomal protein S18 acetylase RimI-like enzyme